MGAHAKEVNVKDAATEVKTKAKTKEISHKDGEIGMCNGHQCQSADGKCHGVLPHDKSSKLYLGEDLVHCTTKEPKDGPIGSDAETNSAGLSWSHAETPTPPPTRSPPSPAPALSLPPLRPSLPPRPRPSLSSRSSPPALRPATATTPLSTRTARPPPLVSASPLRTTRASWSSSSLSLCTRSLALVAASPLALACVPAAWLATPRPVGPRPLVSPSLVLPLSARARTSSASVSLPA